MDKMNLSVQLGGTCEGYAIYGSAFSVKFVKYWNKLPASVVTAPSVNVFKKRLEKVWTEVFPISPMTEHSPPPPLPTCTLTINSCHLYMLPNSLFYIYVVSSGPFRPTFTIVNHYHVAYVMGSKLCGRSGNTTKFHLTDIHTWPICFAHDHNINNGV